MKIQYNLNSKDVKEALIDWLVKTQKVDRDQFDYMSIYDNDDIEVSDIDMHYFLTFDTDKRYYGCKD